MSHQVYDRFLAQFSLYHIRRVALERTALFVIRRGLNDGFVLDKQRSTRVVIAICVRVGEGDVLRSGESEINNGLTYIKGGIYGKSGAVMRFAVSKS